MAEISPWECRNFSPPPLHFLQRSIVKCVCKLLTQSCNCQQKYMCTSKLQTNSNAHQLPLFPYFYFIWNGILQSYISKYCWIIISYFMFHTFSDAFLFFQHLNYRIIIFRLMGKGTVCTIFYLSPFFFYIWGIPRTLLP